MKKLTPRQIFWLRLVGTFLTAVVIPLTTIIIIFNVFEAKTTTSYIHFGFWSIFAIGVLLIVLKHGISYMIHDAPYTFFTQCVKGFCTTLLPLLAFTLMGYILLKTFTGGLKQFMICMIVFICCYFFAIPLNPLPKYLHDKGMENMTIAFDKYFSRKEPK